MRAEAEKRLKKIKQFSRVLRRVCQGLMVLMALVFLISVVASLVGRGVTVRAFNVAVPLSSLSFPQRLVIVTLLALAIGVLLKGLYHLQRLFGNYASGDIFTTETVGQIRQLGITALLWAGANVAWVAVTHTLMRAPSPRSFQLHLDSVAIGLIVIVISWFMEMAAEMHEENELTI
ncbi:DUF2975 family protein [Edaphobacter aggregans]|uniref:DUF2975 family protein n=1 Tax=Edaphobacter aggregans TaxID=570835 RepID=A0A428MN46_9BACT|nr:DUF2975 domain-containing protein [Edaphobacter aggregans]RSL18266.1 DUF2975 family protein [Edaphobacter aggregans]